MKLRFTALNQTEIEIEATSEKEAIQKLSFWQSLPTHCGYNGCAADVHFEYRNIDDNSYYSVVCKGQTHHELSLGQYKKGDGLFVKKEWREAFSNSHQNESKKEILLGEIAQLAKTKGVELTKFSLGVSNNQTNNIDNLSITQLESGLEMLKRK